MALIKFKRVKRFKDEPTITISEGRFFYNVLFAKIAELEKFNFVSYHVDEEERKIAFEFLTDRDDDSYSLKKSGGKGTLSGAVELFNGFPWIRKVAQIKDPNQRSLAVKKEGKLWSVKLMPAFENQIKINERNLIPDSIRGIYRCLDKDSEIVYIGKGDIKRRIGEHIRNGDKFFTIEYSTISKEEEQFEWENYWLLQYKEKHGGRLPYYNNNSGIGKETLQKREEKITILENT